MERDQAFSVVERYVDGWINGDVEAIVSTVTPACLIIESHGPTYHGQDTVRRWAESWFGAGSRVTRWVITSFVFDGAAACFEWDFACTVDGKPYNFAGASTVQFEAGRIAAMREYRMTAPPYDWSE